MNHYVTTINPHTVTIIHHVTKIISHPAKIVGATTIIHQVTIQLMAKMCAKTKKKIKDSF